MEGEFECLTHDLCALEKDISMAQGATQAELKVFLSAGIVILHMLPGLRRALQCTVACREGRDDIVPVKLDDPATVELNQWHEYVANVENK